jgi:hypothetical protein
MSTLAIGALINRAVASMPDQQVYLNIGVWNGFTFLSGIAGNPDKVCIGVDDFSGFGGPREAFSRRFERYRSSRHRFYDMDYVEYFERHHREVIGFYLYDGSHKYEDQLRGLQLAEPFFGKECVVLVDDTNRDPARNGTLDFVAQSRNSYRILMDQKTARNCHPTYWDGIMLLQRVS